MKDGDRCCRASRVTHVVACIATSRSGKSSLLNGLLDEAAVLPTSGSRGCTATVVELLFNTDLTKEAQGDGEGTVPVYTGEVEFMTLEDWRKE